MGYVVGYMGTSALAAATGVEVQFALQTHEDDPLQALFCRAARTEKPKLLRKLSEIPIDDPIRLVIQKANQKLTDASSGGRPKGQRWTDDEKKIRDRIILDWRNGTKYAESYIQSLHRQCKIQSNRLDTYQKKTQRWFFDEKARDFQWSKIPSIKQIKKILEEDKP